MVLKEVLPDIAPEFPVPTLYRYDRPSGAEDRYYYRVFDDKRVGYLSVTSAVGHILYSNGDSKELAMWKVKVGNEYARYYSQFRASYGTQLHIECVEFLLKGYVDWDDLRRRQLSICNSMGYAWSSEQWVHEMCKDIASFVQFCYDYNVEVKFAELAVYSDKYYLAGCIDLGLELDWNKGRVKALVDIKSGKKGFYDSHVTQLHIYKTLFNDLFKEQWEVTHVFNFAPADWREKNPIKPTYKLKNQDKYNRASIIEQDMMLPKLLGLVSPPDHYLEFTGMTNYGEPVGDAIKMIGFEG